MVMDYEVVSIERRLDVPNSYCLTLKISTPRGDEFESFGITGLEPTYLDYTKNAEGDYLTTDGRWLYIDEESREWFDRATGKKATRFTFERTLKMTNYRAEFQSRIEAWLKRQSLDRKFTEATKLRSEQSLMTRWAGRV